MRILAIVILLSAVIAGVLGPQIFFVVDETQAAIVTRFGEPVGGSITTPGLNVKTPFIDKVTYFDKRATLFDAAPDSFLTQDKKRLIIDAYAIGRIEDPLQYFKTVRTPRGAETRGKDVVVSDLKIEIANDLQVDVISAQREKIMAKVKETVTPKLKEFGIATVDVRLKRADFPPQIAFSVYANMSAERKEKANAERAEGAKRDLEIRADVDRKATIIRSAAQRDSDIIRGCGLAEANSIYSDAFDRDAEFFRFQRSLEVYGESLVRNTTVVGPALDLGQIFEEILRGIAEAAKLPDDATEDDAPLDSSLEDVGTRCVTVASRHNLASELGVELEDLELQSVANVDWPDTSLGCREEGKFYREVITPGYRLVFGLQDASHVVHTNQFGSQVITCSP